MENTKRDPDDEPTQELEPVPMGTWAPPPRVKVRRDLRTIAGTLWAVCVIGWACALATWPGGGW